MNTSLGVLGVAIARMLLIVAMVAAPEVGAVRPAAAATQIDIVGPPGSGRFGTSVAVLPNGNIVVTDPYYDASATTDVGAVYLYDGTTATLISTLTGSTAGDMIGSGGVTILDNGHYLVESPYWDSGAAADAGAVTWGNGTTGVSGVVSAANSLVGSTAGDLQEAAVQELTNGNYVVISSYWDNGAAVDAGAVTWGSGTTGVSGVVSAANSLVGSTAHDKIGLWPFRPGVWELSNGNYLVLSPVWDNDATADAGAVTWGNGMTGVSGAVSAANSLVGSMADDRVGHDLLIELSNGNYLVRSCTWHNLTGAVTWGSGTTGVSGTVSAANSLLGSAPGDLVGQYMTHLNNSHYLVSSPGWDNGTAADAGAVTWGSGTTGISGVVSAANSLVGSTAGDSVGRYITALNNGSYVVSGPGWDDGTIVDAGAVTWGSGSTGVQGVISAANSLVGSTAGDSVGSGGVMGLSNGNFVVRSPDWDNGSVVDAGAVTWGSGATGVGGVVSAANSLVGSSAGDQVGLGGVITDGDYGALSDGNYLVRSPYWDHGAAVDAGAVTWGSGTTGVSGVVSAANSLVGTTAGDKVGCADDWCDSGVELLSTGNYVVQSPYWDHGAAVDAGAVTWGSGTTGVSGVVSAANSLVGSTAGDQVGCYDWCCGLGVEPLHNGNYLVQCPYWDHGAAVDAGAVTWGSGTTGISGVVSATNSLVGSTAGDRVGCNAHRCGFSVTALNNGNYLVLSPDWDNGAAADAGAVTWGSGTTGVSGVVSAANSLVGSTAGDLSQTDVGELSNGNYVVRSPDWDNGAAADAGAVTWGSGTSGVKGVISTANSLVGTSAGDQIGCADNFCSYELDSLHNGNYLVRSYSWDSGTAVDAGAVTWGSGTSGVKGVVSAANSLVGSTAGDRVGCADDQCYTGVEPLGSGNYVVQSPYWDHGAAADVGAVTWGSGTTGVSGVVSAANSLVGSTAGDMVGCEEYNRGCPGVTLLRDRDYLLASPFWDNGAAADAGAVTWGSGLVSIVGPITAENSVRGTAAGGGPAMVWTYDHGYPVSQIVVGRPADNMVTLFRLPPVYPVFLLVILRNTR